MDEEPKQQPADLSSFAPEELSATPSTGQLVANLSLERLDEPLFAINNLQASTSYTVHIYSQQTNSPSVLSFSTLAGNLDESNVQRSPTLSNLQLPNQPNLLSTLMLSTRSTNKLQTLQEPEDQMRNLNAGRWLYQYQQQRQSRRPSGNFLSSAIGSLLEALNVGQASSDSQSNNSSSTSSARLASSGKRANSTGNISNNNNQLMDISDALLITSVCIVLLGSLTLMLLLHRYSPAANCFAALKRPSRGSKRRARKSSASFRRSKKSLDLVQSSVSPASDFGVASQELRMGREGSSDEQLLSANLQQVPMQAASQVLASSDQSDCLLRPINAINCSSSDGLSRPGRPSGSLAANKQQLDNRRFSWLASATLDSKLIRGGSVTSPAEQQAVFVHNAQSVATNRQLGGVQAQMFAGQVQTSRVTKSRSSLCFESLANQQQQQQLEQQQQQIQLNDMRAAYLLANSSCNPSLNCSPGEQHLSSSVRRLNLESDVQMNSIYDSLQHHNFNQQPILINQLQTASDLSEATLRLQKQHKQQQTLAFVDDRQTSLISGDESCDSTNQTRCTWSISNGCNDNNNQAYDSSNQQVHFIEILPIEAECMQLGLLDNMLNSQASSQLTQLLPSSRVSLPCQQTLPSSSMGSTISIKDQLVSSPLSSITNTDNNWTEKQI